MEMQCQGTKGKEAGRQAGWSSAEKGREKTYLFPVWQSLSMSQVLAALEL